MRRADIRRARRFQLVFPILMRLLWSSRQLEFATQRIRRPARAVIPTRHGEIRALVYSPPTAGPAPVHLLIHGGAFIIRAPWQDGSIARYLASELGAVVVVPDYDTAPDVRWPIAEEQNYDVYRWILANGETRGWDISRLTIGGASAGSKFAMDVVAQAIEDGLPLPLALTSEFGCADLSRPDETRTSPIPNPIVSAQLIGLARRTYFLGADPHDPKVSVALHPRLADFPPTLIMTGEHDTLRHEMDELAGNLTRLGVDVTHRQFAGVDHGFTHNKPVAVAREAVFMIGDHLRRAYDRIDPEHPSQEKP
ncbi:alpha/beta hydrolase fold domain-containing protein [Kribbella sandramycini]|uniref:Acetyl esterase n=1 Tax=Kribbella sandramycini TaxID=60450 RepID=A0A7Y4L1N6_9ACTN|nr:alpha/beta hydrolase fold domain-containing protein [Kribbella sandramycini]MBB6566631.1 acetyl esterase [Kribbella sandramycini]NOL42714.1 alpha/beta hydrolase fold domain-containing protein [Kribbella sandramycini]